MQQTDTRPDDLQQQSTIPSRGATAPMRHADVIDHPQSDLSRDGGTAFARDDIGRMHQPHLLAEHPDKFTLETRLIELGAALSTAHQLFKGLERDFYLAAFGRYDE